MERIIPLELVGKKQLEYNLYDENNNTLYEKGNTLTPELLLMLNFKKVFKSSENEIVKAPKNTDSLIRRENMEIKSIFSEKVANSILANTKKLLLQAESKESPDIMVCEELSDVILTEINDKIDKVDCIGQFRIIDEYIISHTVNVSSMSAVLGYTLGLGEKDLKDLTLGTLLHDIGKLRIPTEILNKPGKLTFEEFEIMKTHTTIGYDVVKNEMELSERIAEIALQHQEKYGGTGYPHKLKGQEIALFAQITSIIDVYDALVSKRVYKPALPSSAALKILMSEGSKSFNPLMLYKFLYFANYKNAVDIQPLELAQAG